MGFQSLARASLTGILLISAPAFAQGSASALHQYARQSEWVKDFNKAEMLYQTLARAPEWKGFSVAGIARIRIAQGRSDTALEMTKEYLSDANFFHPDVRLAMVEALVETKDLARAETELTKIEKFAPNHADASLVRGLILAAKGDTDAAAQSYNKAKQLDFRHVRARLLLSRARMDQKRWNEARDELKKLVDWKPATVEFLGLYGDVLIQVGDIEGAQVAFERIAKESPSNATAQERLGDIALLRRQTEVALGIFNEAQDLDPDKESISLKIARAYLELGKKKEARAELQRCLSKHPGSEDAARELFTYFERENRMELAGQLVRSFFQKNPNNTWAFRKYSELLMVLEEEETAVDAAELFASSSQKEKPASELLLVAEIFRKGGKFKRAHTFIDLAKGISPKDPYIAFNEALLFEQEKKLSDAASRYLSVVDHPTLGQKAIVNLSGVYEAMGKPNEAIAILGRYPQDGAQAPAVKEKIRSLASEPKKEVGAGK